MAMSFSRPDPSSPASIADATFGTGRRGFDQSEVRDFLRMVAAEFGRLQERERFLERELQTAQASPGLTADAIDDEAMTRLLGEEAMRVLLTARESATEIKDKAEQASARLLSEASDEAGRVREEADIEASRRRGDAAADAEAELSMAKQQGREMVNEARAYRERVLSELARRRELAREQIEQLIHGRDRLMQSFERARLVAVDVVAELQPLGEPDEYVDLTPTTGPVPVMIANSQRPDDSMSIGDGSPAADAASESSSQTADGDQYDGDLRIVDDDIASADDDGDATEAAIADGADDDDEADELAEADTASDAADADITADDATPDAAVEAADEAIDEIDAATDDVAADDDVATTAAETDTDDVVVDLFARLRADNDDATADDATADDAAADANAGGTESHVVDAERRENDIWDPAAPTAPLDLTEQASDVAAAAVNAEALATADAAPSPDSEAPAEPSVFETRDEILTPLIVASAKKLKRVLADEQNEALDALRRSDTVHNLDALLPWASEHAARYTAAISDELHEAVNAGAALSRGNARKMRKALVTECVDAANAVVEQWLVTPLRDRLAQCVADGGGDNTAVTKKARAAYRETKTQHIDETLDDIIRTAHGRGVLAGLDLDTPVQWTVDVRHPACPDCDDNALAGAVAAGRDFPTGHTFAPAHPGCRCLLLAADR